MTDKLPDGFNRYMNNCSDIMNKFPPEGQKHTSQYYDVDVRHSHILDKLGMLSKKPGKFTSADEENMKQLLMDSLELADKKVEITNRLLYMVNDNIFKLEMNKRDIEMTPVYHNESRTKPKRMLKWTPNYKESDSDSIDDVVKMGNSNKRLNKDYVKINKTSKKNVQKKTNLNRYSQTSITTKLIKNIKTTKDKISKTKLAKGKKVNLDSSDSESEIQPTYCVCEQISYGDMVCCDNDLCPIEWFHFSCVSLSKKPKGKWYCPRCRGTTSKIMKPRQIFFKELEEYNKLKEENCE